MLDVYGYDNELWDWSFDLHLKESKSGRVVPINRPAKKRRDQHEKGPPQDQWYPIPTAEIGRVDAVGGTLHTKIVSPLLKATIPLALDRRAKGEGFVATVVRIDQTKEPSAEILIERTTAAPIFALPTYGC